MRSVTRLALAATIAAAILSASPVLLADELTQMIQKDLVALGYDPGTIDGQLTTKTQVAISKFQSDNGMPVTGEPSPQLAGVMSSKVEQMRSGSEQAKAQTAAEAEAAEKRDCEQRKAQATAEKREKATGFRRLAGAGTRLLGRYGGGEAASAATDVYVAGSAASDAAVAADELGITDEDC